MKIVEKTNSEPFMAGTTFKELLDPELIEISSTKKIGWKVKMTDTTTALYTNVLQKLFQ